MAPHDSAVEELRHFCALLRDLRRAAGSPTLDQLRGLMPGRPGISTLSDLLNAKISRVPRWELVAEFVQACVRHARARGRLLASGDADLAVWERRHEDVTRVLEVLERQSRNSGSGGRWQATTPAGSWDSERLPFPGLEAFTEQDSAVFFGRETEIAELLERLHPVVSARSKRLITVVGPSGVGKSSLIHAGLLPRLARRRQRWIVLPTVVPEDRPMWSLTRSLAAVRPDTPAVRPDTPAAQAARVGTTGLAIDVASFLRGLDELRTAPGRTPPVLLVIDQTEELITLAAEGERAAFLRLLADALTADPHLWIIMIMRSEFLTAFLGTEQARLFRAPFAVGTLGQAALLEVIERPARQVGLVFDPPVLVQHIAADAGSGRALPLLAYALQELYLSAGPRKTVTADAYYRIGGVAGVLARQADKVTAELTDCHDASPVLKTLLKFVTVGENEPTRRRARRSALTDAEWLVAEAFIAARLLSSDAHGDDTVLDVAHEALFTSWAPLRHAIEEDKEHLRWRADLERWAMDWENSGRQNSYLLSGPRLTAAQTWAESDAGSAGALPLVAQFLASSSRADVSAMQRLSESIARQALANVDRDPDYSLLLALTAIEECTPTALAAWSLTAALVISQVRAVVRGHDDWMWGVAWSPDGRRLATGSGDRTARVWDVVARDGAGDGLLVTERMVLRGHDGWVFGVAWSPNGRRLATGSADGTVRVWDVETGIGQLVLRGHEGWVYTLAWSPDGQLLATASGDRTARVWDAETGIEQLALRGHDDEVRGVAWSPDGLRLATGSEDRTARVWDAKTGDEQLTLRGHLDLVRWVAWSPDGGCLASGSSDRTVRLWEAETGIEQLALRGHDDEVRGVAWSPDGRRLATASADRTVRVWNRHGGGEPAVLRGHEAWVWGVAWSSDGRRLATASDDQTARVWDADAGGEPVLRGHDGWVRGVAWSPDGRRLATASDDRTARVWDAGTGQELLTLRGHEAWVCGVAWSPDGRRLATGAEDRTARVWDSEVGLEVFTLHGHDAWVRGVAWSPDGRRLATVSADWMIRLWDVAGGGEGDTSVVLRGHDDEVGGVAWSPDGRRLATAAGDRTARVWDAGTGQEIFTLRGHEAWVRGVAWSPDGRRLATAADDRMVRIWDAEAGIEQLALRGHDDEVRGVAWSPDGRRLVTASRDRSVRVWDAEAGIEIVAVGAHIKGVESVAWSPDGRRIASASQDTTSRVWDPDVNIENLVSRARHRVCRELSPEERRDLLIPQDT